MGFAFLPDRITIKRPLAFSILEEYCASLFSLILEAIVEPCPAYGGPHQYVVWLDHSIHRRDIVGGKGASLSLLSALGAPVPKACALVTSAYAAFADSLELPRRVTHLHDVDLSAIRVQIMTTPLPDAVAQAIAVAYRGFADESGGQVPLAVRSSATVEDSAELSFAGLHDTILSVRSLPVLETSIRQCWASMWSDRAIEYRRAGHLDGDDAAIAVIVQQLVRSDVSFVIFTADPVTWNQDHLVISASWGLGEAVVSGLVTPDHIVVNSDGRVIDYRVGHKEHMVIGAASPAEGTRLVPVPRALQDVPVMSHEQAVEIAGIARSLSSRLGHEADLEGGIADGKLYLFQARPITTLRPLPNMESTRRTQHLRS